MTILVAYIPSPQGEAALDRAVLEARAHGTDLLVMNAARSKGPVEARRLEDEEAVDVTERLNASGVPFTLRREYAPGQPYEEVLTTAQEIGAEMIVIGLRRRTPTGKLIFGSNAQRILLDAPCPVLAVKAPEA